MSQPVSRNATLTAAGNLLLVEVSSAKASALCKYLRQHGVIVSPPSPSSTGLDTIELGKGANVKIVQDLLDRWTA
jgi:hypothetical protein